ncbi:protein-(glutamine-N5) methyltransferase, release factor-specific [candidate division KSB3 bacterium]|uniref:Release factor glutamine methyltransferase n=1 Tax=candidate division KSB3 bacterium TaxID=2044937 RepID=A0A2G6EAX4_9BACT|nr:MAG: protein-(glutamine-N5) methyltransferase, release factor-specific [candidate division KSB3 bacterium]
MHVYGNPTIPKKLMPDKQWTILEILRWTTDFFRQKGVDSPRLTAEVLLAHVLEQERIYLYVHFDQPLAYEERERYKVLIRRCANGEPTQYLTGVQEFWSLTFEVTPAVLVPRPETEHLVEAALTCAVSEAQPKILDIGTGCGVIAICLKHELPGAEVFAGDISEDALNVAMQNAERLLNDGNSISFRQGDLFTPFSGMRFDLLISNPPYISTRQYEALERKIRDYEPACALHAGEEGLDIYRRLIANAADYLKPEGCVLLEIGQGQKDAVVELFDAERFSIRKIINDYAGIERVIIAGL